MTATVVIGAQWGDEGKGKLVDYMAERMRYVVRYQGGANAGHTVIVAGKTYKLHLVPSGILTPGVKAVIGPGVVVDPEALLKELQGLKDQGVSLDGLILDGAAHAVLPYHRRLDAAEERRRGAGAIGTTGRGIGPAYADRAARTGLRLWDLVASAKRRARLEAVLPFKNLLLEKVYEEAPLDLDALDALLAPIGEALAPYVADTAPLLDAALAAGEGVLLEGAQGTLLDVDFGTYPFVTSSHPIAAGAALGSGLPPRSIGRVVGVTKAYTTRVGAGPFPTELEDATGERLREAGREFGTTTGRPRRCGWLDAVALRYAARLNGLDRWAVTKLDVLDGFMELRIATAYELDGERLETLPADRADLARVTPVYETLPGWSGSVSGVTRMDALPAEARRYLERLEALTGVPIGWVATGPEREATIVV